MKIDLKKYNDLNRFIRNGKVCIFDKTKQLLRIATPEEEIRQRVIELLYAEMLIPYKAMETEIPISYFVAGGRGRMDIVVYGLKEGQRCPAMVVECKSANVPLTEDVYIQAKKYAEIIDIPILMVTNGLDMDILAWNYELNKYEAIEYLPTYDELCKPEELERISLVEIPYVRHTYEELFRDEIIDLEFEYAEYLGENCKRTLAPHIINLAECFRDVSRKVDNLQLKNYKFIEDGGIRYTSFGNAAGGSFVGFYRYFIIEDRNENTQIVSMAVMGCKNGRTLLIVAIDDMDKHHNSLQLSIEHYSTTVDGRFLFWHDGTLTVGHRGKVKKQEVVDYVKQNSSLKIFDEKIYLGEIDLRNLLYVDNCDMKELITNLIEYALIRDEFRRIKS